VLYRIPPRSDNAGRASDAWQESNLRDVPHRSGAIALSLVARAGGDNCMPDYDRREKMSAGRIKGKGKAVTLLKAQLAASALAELRGRGAHRTRRSRRGARSTERRAGPPEAAPPRAPHPMCPVRM